MKKLWVAVIVGIMVLSLGLTAMAMHIGVVGKAAEAYWAEVDQGAKAAGKALGVKVTFFAPQTQNISQQVSTFQGFMAQKFAGIVVAPSAPNALTPYINKAVKMGIPVVTIDTDAPKSARYYYIGTDNYKGGYEGGKAMVKLLHGKGNVVIITGSLSANNSLERIKGFKDALKGTQIKVLNILNDEEDAAKAFSLAQSAISTYGKKLSGFYGVYYENGPAEANAVKSAGLKPGQIKVVCFDMGPDTLKYLKEGYIQASTVQKPYFMGYFGVVSIYMMKKMGKMGPKYLKMMLNNADHIDTGIYLVTPKNLQDYMAQMKALGVPPAY